MSSSEFVIPCLRLDRDSQNYKDLLDHLIKGEEIPVSKHTSELVKALADEDLESKSQGKDEDLKNRPKKIIKIEYRDGYFSSIEMPDFYARRARARYARFFTDGYKLAIGEKFCIHTYGPTIACSSDSCFESAWVGVQGMQSMCIVTRRDMFEREQDMTRLHPFYRRDCMKRQNMEMFARATISEVECLPHKDVDYYDVAFRELCTGTIKKPFAVVSPGRDVLEEFGYEGSNPLRCCVLKTIEYLESVVPSDLVHTHYGILRVAIKAYQLLMCHKELRADDIWVTIMEDVQPNCFEHLPIDKIGDQLDIVNGLSSGKDPQKPILKFCGTLQ